MQWTPWNGFMFCNTVGTSSVTTNHSILTNNAHIITGYQRESYGDLYQLYERECK